MKYTQRQFEDNIQDHIRNSLQVYNKKHNINENTYKNISDCYNVLDRHDQYHKFVSCSDTYTIEQQIQMYFGNHIWFKEEMKKSFLLPHLLKQGYKLAIANVSFYVVFNIIGTICYQATNNYIFEELCDGFICKRCQISKDTLCIVLDILNCTSVLNVKWRGNRPYVKIDKKLILSDALIHRVYKQKYKYMRRDFNRCRRINKVKYEAYSEDYVLNNRRFLAIGITYLYNKYTQPQNSYLSKNNKETNSNLMYVSIPYHLIQYATGMYLCDLQNYLRKVFKSAKYISKHDKIYKDKIDNNGNVCRRHYFNPDEYKFCPLAKIKDQNNGKVYYEDSELIVDDCSAIIYLDEFYKSNIYKKIKKNENLLLSIIAEGLKYCQNINYSYISKDSLTDEQYNEELKYNAFYIKDNMIRTYYNGFVHLLFNSKLRNKSIKLINISRKIKTKKNKKAKTKRDIRLKFRETKIYEYSKQYIIKCVRDIKLITEPIYGKQEECRDVDLKYYSQLIQKLIDNINEVVMYFKSKNLYDKEIKPIINKYELWNYIV